LARRDAAAAWAVVRSRLPINLDGVKTSDQ
jgi:hypothetical protein